ncbi:MAG TPA: FAD-binding oxidoreductase, partial [Longimicrobiales bacterium]|nr:FAD-binding oxidoreductase [Longimicrobiales bacterium]
MTSVPRRVDVVVVGGGIAGASTVHHLTRCGVDVLLLERGLVGGGATGAAVGVLSPPLRQPFHETVHHRGLETARAIWAFAERSVRGLGRALEELEAVEEAGLDLSGGHVLAEAHSEHETRDAFEALERAGFAVRWMEAKEVREKCGGRGFTGGYRIGGGGGLNPGPAARALIRGAMNAGAVVVEGATLEDVERHEGDLRCLTDKGDVSCEMIVYAAHVDSRRFWPLLDREIVPIRGQAMAADLPAGLGCPGSWSTHWKLNVWRRGPGNLLVLGGWRHDAWDRAYRRTRPEVDPLLQADLQQWYEASFPGTSPLRVRDRWSGIFGWTADYLPLVGALPGTTRELV